MKRNYKKLTPFKLCVLENFPFIAEDFDSLTNYELLCKVVEYLNKVTENNNLLVENIDDLNNWFENLNVQEEINNKLDVMATDGTLATLLEQVLVRRNILVIGDSYSADGTFSDITNIWWRQFRDNLGLTSGQNLFVKATPGAGFVNDGFYNDLINVTGQMTSEQKEKISDVFVVGGWNDRTGNEATIYSKMNTFKLAVKNILPSAKITVAFVGKSNPVLRNTDENRDGAFKAIMYYINASAKLGFKFIKNAQYILHNYNSSYWESDGVHPAQLGQNELGSHLTFGFINGFCDIHRQNINSFFSFTASGIASSYSDNHYFSGINNDTAFLTKSASNFYIDCNNATMSLDGAQTYEIGTISDGYFVGTGSLCSVGVPAYVQYALNGQNIRLSCLATLTFERGKIKIRLTGYYNNLAVQNVQVKYIFLPNFTITTPSQLA